MSQGTATGPEGQAPQAGNQGQGQEPSPGGQGTQGQEPGTQQGTEGQFSLDAITDPAVRAYVEAQQRQAREAREEAARYRTERNTLVQQNETEQERTTREQTERQERMDTLERENRDLKVGAAIQTAAADAKAFNPALVARMLDNLVALDDKGAPTNLQDLLKDLRQSDPYLFKRADANAGDGTGQQAEPSGSMNDTIRNAVRARRGRT